MKAIRKKGQQMKRGADDMRAYAEMELAGALGYKALLIVEHYNKVLRSIHKMEGVISTHAEQHHLNEYKEAWADFKHLTENYTGEDNG